MQMTRTAQEADFIFEVDGFAGELRVLNFTGTEGISELFEFGLYLTSEDGAIDIDSIVGKNATLTIFHDNGERLVKGIVSRFEQGSEGTDFTPYYAELVPEVWLLTQRHGCRIHQKLSVPDIVKKVLTDAGIAEDHFRSALSGKHDKREYCVQYRESDWNFINRLLEEEGIYYFFEHTDDAGVLVMGDADSVHRPIEAPDSIPFRDISGTVAEEEAVFTYRYSQEIRTGKMTFRDFNFEKPTVNLQKDKSATRDTQLEAYDYPGRYLDPNVGITVAELRLQAVQARRIIGLGESLVRRFVPGYKFTLSEHPRMDFNREYLLTWMHHEGTQPHGGASVEGEFRYNNEFRCIPSDVPYRPALRTPRPVMEGTQTAIVTGPSGEEIYPDKHGRVKVQFHWDREGNNDENTSCWIRVSQLWAGKNWGAMWIPRIGHEVIVDFLEGNPDKPIIIGRVYHGDNQPPYKLPQDKTKSTIKSDCSKGGGGSNEIRFEDLKDSEEVFIHAQKDMNEVIENNMTTTVGADRTESVGGNRTRTVKKKEEITIEETQTIVIGKGCSITVKKGNLDVTTGAGEHNLSAKSNANITTDADFNLKATGNCKEEAGSNFTIKAGANMGLEAAAAMSAKAINISLDASGNIMGKAGPLLQMEAGAQLLAKAGATLTLDSPVINATGSKITLSAGGSSITISGAGVMISGAMVKIN